MIDKLLLPVVCWATGSMLHVEIQEASFMTTEHYSWKDMCSWRDKICALRINDSKSSFQSVNFMVKNRVCVRERERKRERERERVGKTLC
jgi:hypothetical protein